MCFYLSGGKKAVSPKQEMGGALGGLSLRRSGEPGEKELRGGAGAGDTVADPNLGPRDGPSSADSQYFRAQPHTLDQPLR